MSEQNFCFVRPRWRLRRKYLFAVLPADRERFKAYKENGNKKPMSSEKYETKRPRGGVHLPPVILPWVKRGKTPKPFKNTPIPCTQDDGLIFISKVTKNKVDCVLRLSLPQNETLLNHVMMFLLYAGGRCGITGLLKATENWP